MMLFSLVLKFWRNLLPFSGKKSRFAEARIVELMF
jgi:hypothetical protein